ncbi:MAG: LPD7 domain-containing protein [Methylococcales bacterium]
MERQVKYLKAIQETLNNHYGLASPKDNRRALFTDDSEMLSRYKGDGFKGGNKVFKSALLTELLERQIDSYDDFKILLAEQGEVKIRNEGKNNKYLWVKPKTEADGKGVNLRDAAFSRAFIELPPLQKIQKLATDSRYEIAAPPRDNQAQYDQALQEWHKQRAKEIKYVYLGKRSEYDAYKQATVEEKAQLLIDREIHFYQNHLPKPIDEDLLTDTNTDHLETTNLKSATPFDRGQKTSVTGQLLHDHKAEIERVPSNQEFAVIKQNLEAKRLLARLSHSHGVNPDKYPISQGQDGGDRIQAGTRKLNVSDFLTKELNLDYRTAGQILREVYKEQTGRALETTPRQQVRADLWKTYQAERQASAAIRKAERQAQAQQRKENQTKRRQAIKTANQSKLDEIRANRSLSPAERERLAAIQGDEYRNGYRNWLASQAQNGDETALAELRKMQTKAKAATGDQEIYSGTEAKPQNPAVSDAEPILKANQLSYQVHRDGAVTYRRGNTDVVRDEGRFVKVLQTEDDTLETGLRLTQAKFGKKLTVRGSDTFKANVARVAAEKGLWVEFTDQHLNQLMEARKAELQQAREKMAVPPPALITPTIKPSSVLSSLEPNTDRGLYTGQVVGIDKRYVYQAHGKDIIRHDRNLFSAVPIQGEKIRISYKGGQMKAELQGKNNTRSRGR